jgi:urea transport system ATP-binding protein
MLGAIPWSLELEVSLELGAWNLELCFMLTLSNITVSYDGSRILRGVNLTVSPGQVVCLMGRNGVGKTTTLKSIVGLVKTDSGSVKLDNTELVGLKPDGRARAGLGYVPQGRDIFPHLTVKENLHIGAIAQGKKLNGEVDRVLTLFPILKEFLARKGGVLSGGQQQQLAIGRALLTNPKVLLLDEPTEGIQPNIIDQIGETIKKLRDEGLGVDKHNYPEEIQNAVKLLRKEGKIGILLVEQYLDFCLDVGDQFYIMDRGAVVAEGAMKNLNDEVVKKHLTV